MATSTIQIATENWREVSTATQCLLSGNGDLLFSFGTSLPANNDVGHLLKYGNTLENLSTTENLYVKALKSTTLAIISGT